MKNEKSKTQTRSSFKRHLKKIAMMAQIYETFWIKKRNFCLKFYFSSRILRGVEMQPTINTDILSRSLACSLFPWSKCERRFFEVQFFNLNLIVSSIIGLEISNRVGDRKIQFTITLYNYGSSLYSNKSLFIIIIIMPCLILYHVITLIFLKL